MMKFSSLFGCLLILALVAACASEPEEPVLIEPVMPNLKDSLSELLEHDSAELQVFLLPTPMQVATVLKVNGTPFQTSYLEHLNQDLGLYSRSKKAELLGVYLADLGYATVHEETEASLELVDRTQSLADELGITNSFNPAMVARFEANRHNTDSLSWLILDGFEKAHTYFQQNDSESMGILIISGCLVEGLYFNLASDSFYTYAENMALLEQQQSYLKNTILLLLKFGNQDPALEPLADDLIAILGEFRRIVDYPKPKWNGEYEVNALIQGKINGLKTKVEAIRAEMIAAEI